MIVAPPNRRLNSSFVILGDGIPLPFAFNGHSLEFLRGHIDIFASGDLVVFDDVGLLHFIAGFCIHFAIKRR